MLGFKTNPLQDEKGKVKQRLEEFGTSIKENLLQEFR